MKEWADAGNPRFTNEDLTCAENVKDPGIFLKLWLQCISHEEQLQAETGKIIIKSS